VKCKDVESNIDSYCAGYLPEELAQVLEAHLASCPNCALTLLDSDDSFESLLSQSWYGYTPSAGFARGVMERVSTPVRPLISYVWVVPLWAFYMSLWGIIGLWLFSGSRLQPLLHPVVSMIRTALVVLRTLGSMVSVFQISELGAILVFAFSLLLFTGIGLLGREVKQ